MPWEHLYSTVLLCGLALAACVAVAGRFVTTPYGRFAGTALRPFLPIRLGWVIMEFPAYPVFFGMVALGTNRSTAVWALCLLWGLHYANRAMLFPLLMQATPESRMSWTVPGMGVPVVIVHAWLYAVWLGSLGTHLTDAWLADPRFWVGAGTWLLGFSLIVHTEHLLRGLRASRSPDTPRYRIPYGGGYRWVSNPHYLGEILAFTGMAIAFWCPGGLFVLAMTFANLVPRAHATHRWYRRTFPDYPSDRKALIPFLW